MTPTGIQIGREHDACGVGFIAARDRFPSFRLTRLAVECLERLDHRGAKAADGTGDGAGLLTQIPHKLIARELHGHEWKTFRIPPVLAKVGAWVREQNPFGEDPFIRSWMVDRASDHYDLDISTARDQLGWNPEHRVTDTVRGRAGAQRFHRALLAQRARDQHERHQRVPAPYVLQRLEAGVVGQPVIGEDQIEAPGRERPYRDGR